MSTTFRVEISPGVEIDIARRTNNDIEWLCDYTEFFGDEEPVFPTDKGISNMGDLRVLYNNNGE